MHERLVRPQKSTEIPCPSREQEPKKAALETLCQAGLFFPVSNNIFYHGRARQPYEPPQWLVNPRHDNTKNNTINGIPTLYTSIDYMGALKFAQAAAKHTGGTPSVERVVVTMPQSYILDLEYAAEVYLSLTAERRAYLRGALKNLLPPIITHRHIQQLELDTNNNKSMEQFNDFIAERHAASLIIEAHPFHAITQMLENKREKRTSNSYVMEFCRNNHIVGIRQPVISGRLGGESFTNYSFFDLHAVQAIATLQNEHQ